MNKKQQIGVSNKIIERLKNKGIKISKYYSKTTKSVYIKLDFGVCGGIRISDHRGKKKYHYKFNVIKGYKGQKQLNDAGYTRLFYNYDNTEELIKDIQNEKQAKINKYGLYNYHEFMKINAKDDLYKRFKNVA